MLRIVRLFFKFILCHQLKYTYSWLFLDDYVQASVLNVEVFLFEKCLIGISLELVKDSISGD